jgi:DNA recombination protein RmuC
LISKKAADLYDKFTGFVSDLEDVGTNIARANKSYDNAMNKLSTGKGNLLRRSQEFLDLGIKPKKVLNNSKEPLADYKKQPVI